MPTLRPPQGTQLADRDHWTDYAQAGRVSVGAHTPEQGHGTDEAHTRPALFGHTVPAEAIRCPMPNPDAPLRGPILRDPVLGLLADVLDDLESVRISNENRVRQLTRTESDSDGEDRGFGLTVDHPEVAKLAGTVAMMRQGEHDADLNLRRALRKHPLGPWMKAQRGIGEKQGARLIAALGDPYWNDLHDRPRTVSQLWAYCGLHVLHASGHGRFDAHSSTAAGVAPRRQKGARSNWSDDARKRTWLIATSCMKSGGPYRDVYDHGRAKYADSLHPADCVRCGPAGKPAPAGTPLSDGHKHARALRLTSKAILRDLWIESRRLHHQQT